MTVHELIQNRTSIRAFSVAEITETELITLLEAARWAPSSMNAQPWRFIIARKGSEAYDRMTDCLFPANRAWAQSAPLLLLTLAETGLSGNNNAYSWHDVGLAIGNMSLQATSLGIYLHQMGGFSREQCACVFNVPSGVEPVSIIAIGRKGDDSFLPENLRMRELQPRARKPLTEIAFENEYGHALKSA